MSKAKKRYYEIEGLDSIRISQQQKQYDFYNNNQDKIIYYLKQSFGSSISSVNRANFYFYYINIVEKIVSALATVYRKPAKISVMRNGAVDEELTKYYNSIIPQDSNSYKHNAEKMAVLQNVSLTKVYFDRELNKIGLRVESSHNYIIDYDYDNPNKMELLAYDIPINTVTYKGLREREKNTIIWTAEEHFRYDSDNNRQPYGNNLDEVNPYGIIPYAVFRVKQADDFWGFGLNDVIKFNEVIDMLFCDLRFGAHLQAWGQPVAINCGFARTNRSGKDEIDPVATGPEFPIIVDNVDANMYPPSFEFKSPNPMLQELTNLIDYHIIQIALSKGLNPNNFIAEVKATSGFSKVVDMINEIGQREELLDPARNYENELFNIIRRINNTHVNESRGMLKLIPEDCTISVDFADISSPKTVEETWNEREKKLTHNMASVVDFIMEENPDLTREQAEELLRNNKLINDEILKGKVSLNAIVRNNNTVA